MSIRDLQKEQKLTVKRNRELMDMVLILLRDTLSSGLEKSSLNERILQKNHKRDLEELSYERLKGMIEFMIKEFRVSQENVKETKQAMLDTHNSVSEREAGLSTLVDNVRKETL